MISSPETGKKVLRMPPVTSTWDSFHVEPVRDLADYQKIIAIRAVTYMSEQKCPYEEEFDGNDLNATHLLAYRDNEPIAALRLRWFAGFGKVERVCVIKHERGSQIVKIILAHAFELAARKGYELMIAQIQARLWPLWSQTLHCKLRSDRPVFAFSDYDYMEIDIPIPCHPDPINANADPYIIIRPEGDWDRPGPLENAPVISRKPAKAA